MKYLTELANRYGSDKGSIAFGGHRYTEFYEDFFSKFRKSDIVFLEIGLLHPMDGNRGMDAPSLRMWREYFLDASIIGFDVDDYTGCSIQGTSILQGDMENPDDLHRLALNGPFDIILEDASHASHHQQFALGHLFSNLKSGGLYIIEDLNWQPSWLEKCDAVQTRQMLRNFESFGRITSKYISKNQSDYLEKNIHHIDFFNTYDLYNEDKTDAVAIIHKK